MQSMKILLKVIILELEMSLQLNCSGKRLHIHQKRTYSKMLIDPSLSQQVYKLKKIIMSVL